MRAETKLPSTQEVITRFVANMERMRTGVGDGTESGRSERGLCDSFCVSFASSSAIVGRLIELK